LADNTIKTARLLLRPFEPSDAAGIARMGRESLKASFLPDWAKTEADAKGLARFFRERMERPDPHTGPVVWAVTLKETGEFIGHAGIGPKEELGGEIELGYAISERYAGRGLATEAAKAAVWWAFERADLEYIAAIVLPENAASRRVLDKLGFVWAGTRRMEHGGSMRDLDYLRLFHLDLLGGPEWSAVYAGEPMAQFFDSRAAGYEAHMLEGPMAEEDYADAVAPVEATERAIDVLDLGCGTGLELKWLFRRAPNTSVTCVDIAGNMLDKLRSNYRDRLGQIAVVQASYLDWQYPSEAYDYALSANTMHHFTEPVKVDIYRNILKALKPGGMYIEADFMVDDVRMEQYRRRCRRIMEAAGMGGEEPGALHADMPFTPMLQRELLRSAGFSTVYSYKENIRLQGSGAVIVSRK
jgi:tRNA (cmo5U34)-methyltransferase